MVVTVCKHATSQSRYHFVIIITTTKTDYFERQNNQANRRLRKEPIKGMDPKNGNSQPVGGGVGGGVGGPSITRLVWS